LPEKQIWMSLGWDQTRPIHILVLSRTLVKILAGKIYRPVAALVEVPPQSLPTNAMRKWPVVSKEIDY
jgi:hypothetical protein